MSIYEVRQTITFYWHIEAGSTNEAIELSHDIGDSQADLIKHGQRYATKKRGV